MQKVLKLLNSANFSENLSKFASIEKYPFGTAKLNKIFTIVKNIVSTILYIIYCLAYALCFGQNISFRKKTS